MLKMKKLKMGNLQIHIFGLRYANLLQNQSAYVQLFTVFNCCEIYCLLLVSPKFVQVSYGDVYTDNAFLFKSKEAYDSSTRQA